MATFERVSPVGQRMVCVAVLVAAGLLSLPLSALALDGSPATENYILPAQFLVMALLGAGLAAAFPALAPAAASPARRLLTGAAWGLLAALAGLAVFWLLLNGISGA